MSLAYESLAHNLRYRREKLFQLHPELRFFLRQEKQPHWTERHTPGWSREEIAALSHFLRYHPERSEQIQTTLSVTGIWRMETAIPVNRKAITTYCYLLGLEWEFVLQPLRRN